MLSYPFSAEKCFGGNFLSRTIFRSNIFLANFLSMYRTLRQRSLMPNSFLYRSQKLLTLRASHQGWPDKGKSKICILEWQWNGMAMEWNDMEWDGIFCLKSMQDPSKKEPRASKIRPGGSQNRGWGRPRKPRCTQETPKSPPNIGCAQEQDLIPGCPSLLFFEAFFEHSFIPSQTSKPLPKGFQNPPQNLYFYNVFPIMFGLLFLRAF